jgi:hypothetical protein
MRPFSASIKVAILQTIGSSTAKAVGSTIEEALKNKICSFIANAHGFSINNANRAPRKPSIRP